MSPRALVITDSPVSRNNARRALEAAGLETSFQRADEDIGKIQSEGAPAIILLALPEPLRLAMVRRLRALPGMATVPILVIVESSTVLPRVLALQAGARDCVAEPYDQSFLAACASGLVTSGERRAPRAPGLPGRILIVDDSATYSSALSEELRRDGHDVVIATSAAEALEILVLQPVDEVVLDVFMPHVGGVELCSRIRANAATQDVPVLMLTGRKDTTLRDAGLAVGADDFVLKSGDFDIIRTHVSALLRHGPTARASRAQRHAAHGAPPPSSSRPRTFADRVITATGLSPLMGKSSVERACARAGLAPEDLTPENLEQALPHLTQTLRVFLNPDAAEARQRAVAGLCGSAHEDSAAREA